ncbi:lytic transglycosylase domain-containing protein [Cupriavidus gilardii]|uniref:transglycosylase SLT domain-containing protein n=1 Tax=Cupriavidus gilardii TaxID=82541 RepID=UPI001EE5D506|nr:transglycosylase SLT domain-containing protein [Cupriavidus gilardii]MCG5260655.1 transglycosylase SLT domain-containing protein [Cupriavidus gilardii]MDF9430384.1 lytic transglycosylase domain-containing protein [Cupriavidus gilardii]
MLASVLLSALALLLTAPAVHAGAQREEQLADAVRGALAAAIADGRPARPVFASAGERQAYLRWVAEMSRRLERRIPEAPIRTELVETVYYEARRAGLEPALVLGLIQVESNFRKYAISTAGARGLMQVMPFWVRTIGDGDARKLFHLQSNLRYGCTILRHYLDRESGDLFLALGRYNGSRGRADYPNAVLAAWKRWQEAEAAATVASASEPTGALAAAATNPGRASVTAVRLLPPRSLGSPAAFPPTRLSDPS